MASARQRRFITGLILVAIAGLLIVLYPDNYQPHTTDDSTRPVLVALDGLAVKGRAPTTGYQRSQFGNGWSSVGVCDTRNLMLRRDMSQVVVDSQCQVISGQLADPYTGDVIEFRRGPETSQAVQIDHVVALSDAWQKGAQSLSTQRRVDFANDPLNLLAVSGKANSDKSDSDAASWLPPNKAFRCQYVARQVAVKQRYQLWVTISERDAIKRVMQACPSQPLPTAKL